MKRNELSCLTFYCPDIRMKKAADVFVWLITMTNNGNELPPYDGKNSYTGNKEKFTLYIKMYQESMLKKGGNL